MEKISVLAARDAPGLLAKMLIGSDGSCIGIANIAPEYWAKFTTECLAQDFNTARETFMTRLLPLMQHCSRREPAHAQRIDTHHRHRRP